MSEKVLIPVREYTRETFSSIMATKKPFAKIITSYISENLELEKQLQEITGRPDLKLLDFLAFGVNNTYGVDMQPKHIGRAWNLAPSIRARIGIPEPVNPNAEPVVEFATEPVVKPVMADLTLPKPITPLPLKSVVKKIGTLGTVKSKSVQSEIEDIKSRLEQLVKQQQ